jgi:hypothetical protein
MRTFARGPVPAIPGLDPGSSAQSVGNIFSPEASGQAARAGRQPDHQRETGAQEEAPAKQAAADGVSKQGVIGGFIHGEFDFTGSGTGRGDSLQKAATREPKPARRAERTGRERDRPARISVAAMWR